MTQRQSRSLTKSPTKTPTFNLQDSTLRRRSSLRSFGTFSNPFPTINVEPTPSVPANLSRRVSHRSSTLRHELPDSAVSEAQESPRGTKRKASSPESPTSPRKRRIAARKPLPPSKPTAPPQPLSSEAPRRKSSALSQPVTAATPTPEVSRRRSTLRSYNPFPLPTGLHLPRGVVLPAPGQPVPPPPKPTATPALAPEVVRRRSTLRSYNPFPLPPGLHLPRGVVLLAPGQPVPPPPKPTPKHICLRGKPPCGMEFPTRAKLHMHQRARHGGAPLGWLQAETAKVVAKGKTIHRKEDDDGVLVQSWTTGKDTPECHVCGKQCSKPKLLDEHLQKVHGIGVVIELEDD